MNPSHDYGRPPTLRVNLNWNRPRLPRDTVIASIGSCFSEELVGELFTIRFRLRTPWNMLCRGRTIPEKIFSSSTACTTRGFITVLFLLLTLIAPWMAATVLW